MLTEEVRQRIHRNMVESRKLDERLILLQQQGLGHFWTGGPGEEAFNSCLGTFLRLGRGPRYDFLLPHYRSSAIALLTGEKSIDFIRQMLGRATDPFSYGRNFSNHFCNAERNLGPVSSPVNSQFVLALGTARAQKPHPDAVTVVIGGDASTHSGDFASLLVWSTRPGDNLPILIVVTNNRVGISTPYATQHANDSICARVAGYGIPSAAVDGLCVDESYRVLDEAFSYVRRERKPFFVEAEVSRLMGHSSASGTRREPGAADPLERLSVPDEWVREITVRLRDEADSVLAEPPATGPSAEEFVWGECRPWPPSLRR
jgi:2-oxoisovalerate dehydrogenase E1 component subunit alpha